MGINVKPRTILCIPGNWKNTQEVITSIATSNMPDFIAAGKIMMHVKTQQSFEIEICGRDERMRDSFAWAGQVNRVSKDFLDSIDQHSLVVYIIGETGNFQDAKAVAEAGLALLKAGGTGIKVESTGKAFTKEHWTRLLTNFEESNLYEMFVLDCINDGKGTTHSCGMHNIGLKDTIVSGVEFQEAVQLLSTFGYYQIVDKPTLRARETFGVAQDAPRYEMVDEPRQPYKGDELFENPFGMWRLKRK